MARFVPPTGHQYWVSDDKQVLLTIREDLAQWRILQDKISGYIPREPSKRKGENAIRPEWKIPQPGVYTCDIGGMKSFSHNYRQLPGMPAVTYLDVGDPNKPLRFCPTSCIRDNRAYVCSGIFLADEHADPTIWTRISREQYMHALDEPWMHEKPTTVLVTDPVTDRPTAVRTTLPVEGGSPYLPKKTRKTRKPKPAEQPGLF